MTGGPVDKDPVGSSSRAAASNAINVNPSAAALTLAVVICSDTEERWEMLTRAVSSVCGQTVVPQEIVVVIDHSPPLLAKAQRDLSSAVAAQKARWGGGPGFDRLTGCAYGPLTIVANNDQPGWPGARNTGLAAARADVIAFLDDAAVAAPDWTERLLSGYRDPTTAGVGGQVVPDWEVARPAWFPAEFEWVVGSSPKGTRSSVRSVLTLPGANLSFRRSVLIDTGGFQSHSNRARSGPLRSEDADLCVRATAAMDGSVLGYEPNARVLHTVTRPQTTWPYFRSRCFDEGLAKAIAARADNRRRAVANEPSLATTVSRGLTTSLAEGSRGQLRRATSAAAVLAGAAAMSAGYVVGQGRKLVTPARAVAARDEGKQSSARATLLPLLALPLALLIWQLSLPQVDLRHLTDLGLISVLPISFWVALGILTVGFCFAVGHTPLNRLLLFGYLVALIAVIHGTPAIVYGTLRDAAAWRQVAVVDYIARHGRVHSNSRVLLSSYQAWPGFYGLNALLNQASGFASSLSYASWVPPITNLIVLGPMALIVRRFTADRRLMWATLWVFLLANWVGQDYFSPQAYTYFLYLTVLAICLRWYQPIASRGPAPIRLATTGILVALVAVIATTHPLTAFMLIAALTVLVLFRRGTSRVLPVVLVVFTLGWIAIGTRSFFADNLHAILIFIGRPDASTSAGALTGLTHPSPGPALVDRISRALSALVWGLGLVGLLNSAQLDPAHAAPTEGSRRGREDLRRHIPLLLLALSPLPLIVASNFSGEMLSRIYLFSLPFIAFFAATIFFPRSSAGRSKLTPLLMSAVSVALVAGLMVSYYGKEQVNYFTPAEVAAAGWLDHHAPAGSLIVAATSNLPFAFSHFEAYDFEWFALQAASTRRAILADPAGTLSSIMAPADHPTAFLILTRSQAADIDATGLMPPGWLTQVEHALLASGRFGVAYRSDDALILTLR